MRYLTILMFGLSLLIPILSSCDKEATDPTTENGYLIVHLTDAPAIFDAVNITFSEISAHLDSEWVFIKLKSDSTGKSFTQNDVIVVAGQDNDIGSVTLQ